MIGKKSLVVSLFSAISLFFVACGSFSSDSQTLNSESDKSTSKGDSSFCSGYQSTVCKSEQQPKRCSISVGSVEMSVEGINSCYARRELQKFICETDYADSVTADDLSCEDFELKIPGQ